ncbi:MAG: hypothetical protein ABSH20_15570 [Tepidisphaeraceae bacterium]|jgi:hypothetical protein
MGAWPIPKGFEQLIRDHIRQTRGEERNHLLVFDFPSGQGVRLSFQDGSFAWFENAFFLEDRPRRLVAVFTEHCGYHVFPSGELSVAHIHATGHGGVEGVE